MSTTIGGERDQEPERGLLRAAVLREAAAAVGARDVLLVHAPQLDGVRLVEGLVCAEHWRGPMALDLAREPLLLRALTGDRVLHCCPRRPRRICGPYWSTAATLVPHDGPQGPGVVVFAGGRVQPGERLAREAAAMAAAVAGADGDGDGLLPAAAPRPCGVVVVRAAGLTADRDAPRRLTAAARGPAGAPHVVRTGPQELCLLVADADPLDCERVAAAVHRALAGTPASDGDGAATGWALSPPGEPIVRAVAVARAMAQQELRRRKDERA